MSAKSFFKNLIENNRLFFPLYLGVKNLRLYFTSKRYSDETYLKKKFSIFQDYPLDLENPLTLNEKLQWLKIHDRQEHYTIHADKYAAREYIAEKFGKEYLIPLPFHTTNYRDLKPENLPDYPIAMKTNHGFGNTVIVRDKNKEDWKEIRHYYRKWMKTNYFWIEREWQYKNIEPRIVVEKMLFDKDGYVPNDYKLNFVEGKLEFIYVSVDREGSNKRNIYDANWKQMDFTWARKGKDLSDITGEDIDPPATLDKMIEFGKEVAKLYKYVRVDFYDVDGVLYFGEITQCHGGGFDQLLPYEMDLSFGEKIDLSTIKS
ncbi:ATP-grasp fold amidoligase family protein [Carboxylicivirga sp. N1Y90]|uniref:ATP-grasp fold amidoligase family protein n=1 Tax=Carboxylicivirga fragile TaxID=3417571 RepID=UPI003D345F4D|nr:hypothetical protein [Marinilabiliaceae bacterium N1Y90]